MRRQDRSKSFPPPSTRLSARWLQKQISLDLTGLNPRDTDFAKKPIRSIAFPAVTLEGEEQWEELVMFGNIELHGDDGQESDASHMFVRGEEIRTIVGSEGFPAEICRSGVFC